MGRPDLVCLSHLRWDFVTQRPNHLLTRAARDRRVFFVEEPLPGDAPALEVLERGPVTVVRPMLPEDRLDDVGVLRLLMDRLVAREAIVDPWLWYLTPAPIGWTDHLAARAVVYDCMDDLSAFRGASSRLASAERRLLARADVVCTGGHALYEAKRHVHPNVHPFPSSVDVVHVGAAMS